MRLMSFDIGIKNMAYCTLSYDPSATSATSIVSIVDWTVLNLMEKEEPNVFCTCILAKSLKLTKKQKKENVVIEPTKCGRKAKFQKAGIYYCETHTKSNTNYLIPKKIWSQQALKKLKVDGLLKICEDMKIPLNMDGKLLKKTILEKMDAFFLEKCYEPVDEIKNKSAKETDLITIGRNMKTLMDQIPDLDQITHVIMENQISPIANRMKTVQGMLAQYFIMRHEHVHIEFVSSMNKLRFLGGHSRIANETHQENEITNTVSNTFNPNEYTLTEQPRQQQQHQQQQQQQDTIARYKEHKLDGVFYSRKILSKNPGLTSWETKLDTKKKDDLADCFLQGIWYMHHKKMLEIDDNYSIGNAGQMLP